MQKITQSSRHTILGVGPVTFAYKIRKHFEAPETWIIKSEVSSTRTKEKLGSIEALVFCKDSMRHNFHGIMDMHSEETLELAISIFTSDGRIRPEFISNPVRRGSGVWGPELNEGSIILIETIRVIREKRKKGIGHWLLTRTLQIPEVASDCKFAFAWPTVLNLDGDCPDEERETRCALILKFFHDAGFRRVGSTNFVGYAINDASHPSRILPAYQDPPAQISDPLPFDELAAKYPLHVAIANEPDDRGVRLIIASATLNPASIREQDYAGNTPLHIASYMGKIQVVRQILKYAGPQAASVLNNFGCTPLAQLRNEISGTRDFFKAMISGSGVPYSGVDKEKCMVILELSRAMNLPVPTAEPGQEPWTAFKWGCTCGKCLGGWLSPRMKYRLHVCAEITSDMLANQNFPARKSIQEDNLEFIPMGRFIPKNIRKAGVYPSYVKGYSMIFSAIARITAANSNTCDLSEQAIIRYAMANGPWTDCTLLSHYLHHGGTAAHALCGLLYRSWEEGPGGDNSFVEVREFERELNALPMCLNDDGHALVCNRLGLPEFPGTWAPIFSGAPSDDVEDATNRKGVMT